MDVNETKMGAASIIYPILRNLQYIEERDELTCMEELNFASYLPNPKLGTDHPLEHTQVVDKFSLPVNGCSIDLEQLTNKIIALKPTEALGISSLVKTKNGIRHIGMIDFLTEHAYLQRCVETVQELGEKGFIVKSSELPEAYHFYSTKDLLTEQQFIESMQRLKTLRSVGTNWPELQLKQGFALLRISTSAHKKSIPYIVAHIR